MFFVAVIFQSVLFCAAFNEQSDDIPWAIVEQINCRAMAYNEQVEKNTQVNLSDWPGLLQDLAFHNKIDENSPIKPMSWLPSVQKELEHEVDTIHEQLQEYQTNIDLYQRADDASIVQFIEWLSQTDGRHPPELNEVFAYANELQRQYDQLSRLIKGIHDFHVEKLKSAQPTLPDVMEFIAENPGEELERLLRENPSVTNAQIENSIKQSFLQKQKCIVN